MSATPISTSCKLRLNFITATRKTQSYLINYSQDGGNVNKDDIQYLLNAMIANTDALSKDLVQSKSAAIVETAVFAVPLE